MEQSTRKKCGLDLSVTQRTLSITDNIAMSETQRVNANRVYSKTPTSLVIYLCPNPHEVESYVHWVSKPVSQSHALAQKQTASRSGPEAEIISLGEGLRMKGYLSFSV